MPAPIVPGVVYALKSGRFARVVGVRGSRVRAIVVADRHDPFGSRHGTPTDFSADFLAVHALRMRGTPEQAGAPV